MLPVPASGLDRHTVIVWLVTALVATTGGSLGTKFVASPDRFYGEQGRALEAETKRLKTQQEKFSATLQELQQQQGIFLYRQNDCMAELKKNDAEHKDLSQLIHRLERLEWDVERINNTILSGGGPKKKQSRHRDSTLSEHSMLLLADH